MPAQLSPLNGSILIGNLLPWCRYKGNILQSVCHLAFYYTFPTFNNHKKRAFWKNVEKGENTGNLHFLLFQQYFYKAFSSGSLKARIVC